MGEALTAFLGAVSSNRDLRSYAAAFLRKDGQPLALSRLKVFKNDKLRELIATEQARLIAVFEEATKVQALADTGALLTVAQRFLTRYEALKKIRSLLDYDDLILGMRQLLIDPGAAWVHYKLDRGIDHVLVDEAQDTNPEQWQVIAALV